LFHAVLSTWSFNPPEASAFGFVNAKLGSWFDGVIDALGFGGTTMPLP
jgi:hypothetical protein